MRAGSTNGIRIKLTDDEWRVDNLEQPFDLLITEYQALKKQAAPKSNERLIGTDTEQKLIK